jgi:hypothetical protein
MKTRKIETLKQTKMLMFYKPETKNPAVPFVNCKNHLNAFL